MSHAGPDSRIQCKITTWDHANEVQPGWYERVWPGWDADKLMRNLHPTHIESYGLAERIPVPEILQPAIQQYRQLVGFDTDDSPRCDVPNWPKVSVVIPLPGGTDDICQCLHSLEDPRDLRHEVVVVDNASPDYVDTISF